MMPVVMYLTLNEAGNTSRIDYKIYYMADSVETYDNTVSSNVQPEWGIFYQEIDFYDDTQYKVYAYKADGTFLCSGIFDVFLWSDDYDEDW